LGLGGISDYPSFSLPHANFKMFHFFGGHLSGRATGRVDLARSLAVITGDFAQEVELRLFFASRIDVICAKAAIAKTSAKDLELSCKGGNKRKARTVVHDINETMRSAGEDFDSSGDDVSEYLKCAPPTRQTPTQLYTADSITLLEHTLT
jgi:hypothetical protein